MKVLMLNGSPRKDGNTSIALREMALIFAQEGIECRNHSGGAKGRARLHCLQPVRQNRQMRV